MTETAKATSRETRPQPDRSYLVGFLPALQRLDQLLERAVTVAQAAFGPEVATDFYRGLYISQAEVQRLLARQPGAPTIQPAGQDPASSLPDPSGNDPSRLAWLQQAFSLGS